MIIAIDGPSGAGKSTVSKAVARRLDFSCLDTGAMYRCVAWKALDEGVSLDDAEALARIAHDNDIAFTHEAGDPTSPTPSARRKSTAPSAPLPPFPLFARRWWPSSSALAAQATTWWKAAISARRCFPRPS